jgi:alpha-D-ribose 1-methylphosphonate 5-triphosphate synthase subunit PhnG
MVSSWERHGEIMTRGERMSMLALSSPADLEQLWGDTADKPSFDWIRPPEFGAVMARGRICDDGSNFNVGEVAITRCILRLAPTEHIGIAYVIGRRRRHATLAALLDAMAQTHGPAGDFVRSGILRLRAVLQQRRQEVRASVAKSEVDFSMLLRA